MTTIKLSDTKARAIQVAIAQQLGLNLEQIEDGSLTVFVLEDYDVQISWRGFAVLPREVVADIVENAGIGNWGPPV